MQRKMVVLSRHRPEASHLPEQPLRAIAATAQIGRIKPTGLASSVYSKKIVILWPLGVVQ